MVTGHGWFYRGCRECFICGKVHAPPEGFTEDDVERYRYRPDAMPWGRITADPTSEVLDYDWDAQHVRHDRIEHVGL